MLRPLVFLIGAWYGQAVALSPSESMVRSELLPGGSTRLLPSRDPDDDVDVHAKASGIFAQASSSHGLARLLDIQDSGQQFLDVGSRDSAIPNPPATSCKHHLSGVDDIAVTAALNHKVAAAVPKAAVLVQDAQRLQSLQHQHIYITACLHQSEKILPSWTSELVRLVLALKGTQSSGSVFVSIYESGSSDRTKEYLELLQGHLDFLKVPHNIVHGDITRGRRQRIEFLADVRNRAMEPLLAAKESYDRVLWLSDNIFCADGVLQMLAHALPEAQGGLGADAVCGMDYAPGPPSGCVFYDIWAAHDMSGQRFQSSTPVVSQGEDKLLAGQPFQVFSCWNAMVVFDADIFQKERLHFRTHRDKVGECAAAETELIFRDMTSIGRGKIVVSPEAASAYSDSDFKQCAQSQQPVQFDRADPIKWAPAPDNVQCCPLRKDASFVDFSQCFEEKWDRFGHDVPRQVEPEKGATLVERRRAKEQSSEELVERSRAMAKRFALLGSDAFVITNVLNNPDALDMHKKFAVLATGAFMFFLFCLSQTGLQQRHPLAVPILIWGCSSIMMNVMNKLAVTILPLPLTLVSIQMLIAATVVFMAMGNVAILRELSEKRKSTMIWAALTLPFTALLVTSMLAVENGTVTTLLIVRNALPLVALFVERMVLPQNSTPITLQACLSLGTIALGTLVYTFFELKQTKGWFAILCICANMVITVGYRVLERRTLIDSAMTLSMPAMVLINNTVGLLPISFAVLCRHEYLQWGQLPLIFEAHLWKEPASAACIILSGCTGLSLSFFSITVQKQVSATHMLTLQSSFKILIILLAMLLLNDRLSPMTGFGCAASLIGSMWYAYASQKPAQKEALQKETFPK